MCESVWVIITKAVRLVGNKGLAGGGDLLLSAQYGFDDEVLHLPHQHWHRDNRDIRCISHPPQSLPSYTGHPECTLPCVMVEMFDVDDTQWSPF